MKIFLTNTFKRSIKKLHSSQISEIETAIEKIKLNPKVGELKKGDLAGVRVYKTHLSKQLNLISYDYNDSTKDPRITLLSFGPHENFYSELKKQIK